MKLVPPSPRLVFAAVLAVLLTAGHAAAEYAGRTPPRLSLIEGQASFWRAGAEEWEPAEPNTPLGPGDFLYTAADSRLEIQIGARAFVRAAALTQVGVIAHEGEMLRLDVGVGRVSLDLRDLAQGARVEVGTPAGQLAVVDPGLYDVEVGEGHTRFAAQQGGRGAVRGDGEALDLRPGAQIVFSDGGARVAAFPAPAADDWLRWNSARTDRILAATSRSYVSEDIYGIHDLDNHGSWRQVPTYGRVWVPAAVPVGWAPYTTGRWLWDTDYGWTWIDAAPWGWAPYHYGRWVYVNSFWAWAPGPVLVRPVYAPALVAFLGAPGIGIGVSVGVPFVSWVALGWGEPVIPWWGPAWYRGNPCWYGWGGPTIINNVYVDRRGKYRHGDIKHYGNQRVRGGVVAVPRDRFARHAVQRERLRDIDSGRLRPLGRAMPVAPREAGVRRAGDRGRARPPRPEGMRLTRAADRSSVPELRLHGSPDEARRPPLRDSPQAARPARPDTGESQQPAAGAEVRRPQRGERPAGEPSRAARPQMPGETSVRPPVPGSAGERPAGIWRDPRRPQRDEPRSAATAVEQPRRPAIPRPGSPTQRQLDDSPARRDLGPSAFQRLDRRERPAVPRVDRPERIERPPAAPPAGTERFTRGPRYEPAPAPGIQQPGIAAPRLQPPAVQAPSAPQAPRVRPPSVEAPSMQPPAVRPPRPSLRSEGASLGGRSGGGYAGGYGGGTSGGYSRGYGGGTSGSSPGGVSAPSRAAALRGAASMPQRAAGAGAPSRSRGGSR